MLKKLTAVILSVIMCVPFVACVTSDSPPQTTTTSPDTTASDTPPSPNNIVIFSDGNSEYSIVRPDSDSAVSEISAALSLNAAFQKASGKLLPVVTDWEKGNAVAECEICIGELTRNGKYYNIDVSSLEKDEFLVKVCEKRIIMTGQSNHSITAAVKWFIDEYLAVSDGSQKELEIPCDFEYIGKYEIPTGIRIMTQNLLATDTEYANATTVDVSEHTIEKRKSRILSLIKTYAPDSLGVQECSSPWRTYFKTSLSSAGYKIISADKNPKIGIIYNPTTLKPLANGSFWLSEKPESLKISPEWGPPNETLIERLAMYVVFEVTATGERFIHFNTHVETPRNDTIQLKQSEVILSYIEKLRTQYNNIPIVLTGDFNYTDSSNAYAAMIEGGLADTKKACTISSGKGSFNKFRGKDYASKPIDQIFATPDGYIFNQYEVIYDTFNGCFASDHYAVISYLELKRN